MAKHPIRFGLQTGQQNVEWQDMLDLWRKADGWGYDSLWNFDHFYPIFTDPEGRMNGLWKPKLPARKPPIKVTARKSKKK